ncbi:ribonuclease H-like domain-containing protein, partial [Tanacetum coccineum]
MLAINGVGFDWSDMVEEQVQTNMALMVFSDSEAITHKRGLDTIEVQLVTYRKNEVLFSEEVDVLKREVGIKQYEINMIKTEFEKVKQEKDAIDFKIEKFGKASKDLDQLLRSQITDKSKKGFGYSAVHPPYPLIYNRPNKLDLSYSDLDEFKEPEFKGYVLENKQLSHVKSSFVKGCGSNTSKSVSKVEPKKVRKNNDALIIKDWVSDDKEQDESKTKPEKKTVIPTAAKIEKLVKKLVRYAEMYRSQSPRGNQRNWNGQKSNQLGSEFVMYNKACFICGSFNHVQKKCTYHQKKKVGKPQHDDKGFVDSGCSRHMTGNIAYLSDFKQFDGGYVAFGGGQATHDDKSLMIRVVLFVTGDYSYSRFTWVFFLTTKDETSEILKRFIKQIENLVDKKVKIIKSDNGTEFKNKVMDDFCREKGIKREYSVARTPQQNSVAERRSRTLIEAARTMLADSLRLLEHCYVHEA